ncbi:rhamnulokinase family protein [Ureibacillus sp. GCM10028918]|uniref:rhamnulokinase n=1 Tax=Ureibacillus sp. GCM10028918 TaxID=3273429 RepID=UPI0036086634
MTVVLAYDLGASSGRLTAQKFDGEKLSLSEVHRFKNEPIQLGKHYYWDYPAILKNMSEGLNKVENNAASLGIDTWGVDIGLLNTKGKLISNPFSYRDTHTVPFVQELEKTISHKELFKRTGNEISPINTLFQLLMIQEHHPWFLEEAKEILLMPNLFVHALSNEIVNEKTIASTTQLLNIQSTQWDENLIHSIFNRTLPLSPIENPHQIIGELSSLPSIKIALVPGHDTACALSALPIEAEDAIFISLGTWGVIGMEIKEPVLTMEAFNGGFTNERTSEGDIRFQKNATGFWMMQQLRKEWRQLGMTIDFNDEREVFHKAKPFQSLIQPEDASFFNPSSMSKAIQAYCQNTNQPIPNTVGEFIRCVSESMAMHYANVINQIEELSNRSCSTIYIGGGGAQNEIICQLIANATGKKVVTGPAEASSLGNGVSQLRALGEISSLEQGRQLIKQSFTTKEYEPQQITTWQEMRLHYAHINKEVS